MVHHQKSLGDGSLHSVLLINRDPAFWIDVASHPEVSKRLLGFDPEMIRGFVANPNILPLASTNGGFLFCRLDNLGRCWELHTLFKPEGWGREALLAAKDAATMIFEDGDAIITYEIEGDYRSRPPKTFGFKPLGPFRPGLGKNLRSWLLSREDWSCR